MRFMAAAVLLCGLAASAAAGVAARPPETDAPVRPPSLLRLQALDVFRRGLYREAARLSDLEASTASADSDAMRDSMWAFWYSGQYSRTAQAGHRLLRAEKDDLEALNLTARSHLFAGERRAALKDYLRSIEVDPVQTAPRYAAGRLYEWFRRYRTAIHYAEWTLEDMPQDAGLHALIGRSRFYLEQYPASARAWHRAVALSPDNLDFRLSEAHALYFAGKKEQALELAGALNAEQPRYWPAVDFLVAVSLLRKDLPAARGLLETALASYEPKDEPRLLFLADLYLQQGDEERFLGALERLLGRNPRHAGALLAKASYLSKHGRPKEAAQLYAYLARENPGAGAAWLGLGAALSASTQTAAGLEAVRQARRLDPTDPDLLLLDARYRHQNGDKRGSKRMLVEWLKENEGEILPVLLYHGLAKYEDDPMLAFPVHMSSAAFAEQIGALAAEGFVSVTAEQAAAWFRGEGPLPKRPVLITFDDARLDSIRSADPVLRRFGFKAALYVPLHVLTLNLHPFASWADLRKLRATGRWDLQAHGDWAHTFVEADEDRRGALYLPSRKWLEGKGRLESTEEWLARASRDYRRAKERLERETGRLPSTFAFPEGDFGQFGLPNLPGARDLNLQLCREAYTLCFHQDATGLNLRSRDPAQAARLEVRAQSTGADLIKLIGDQDPRVRVRRALLRRAIEDRRPREALSWLEANKRTEASDPLLWSDEGRIRFAFGDRVRGLRLARQALAHDSQSEYQGLVSDFERRMRPAWAPTASYFRDDHDRRHFQSEQALGAWPVGVNLVKPAYSYGVYSQTGFPRVSGHGLGAEVSRYLSLFHVLTLRGHGYAFSGGAGSGRRYAFSAALHSQWSDPAFTEAEAGVLPYLTARAVAGDITERYASVAAGGYVPDSWQGLVRLRGSTLSDDNARVSAMARLSHPFSDAFLDLRLVYQLSVDAARRRSADYYSPQRLVMAQFGAAFIHEFSETFKADLAYLPGYGRELPEVTRLVHRLDAGVSWLWRDSFVVRPYYAMTRAPLYRGETLGLSFSARF